MFWQDAFTSVVNLRLISSHSHSICSNVSGIDVETGNIKCGAPTKLVNSTCFTSERTNLSLPGGTQYISPARIELRNVLLPDPVAPAIRRCGSRGKSSTTKLPIWSMPNSKGIRCFLLLNASHTYPTESRKRICFFSLLGT